MFLTLKCVIYFSKTGIGGSSVSFFYVPFRIAGKEPKWTEVTHKKRANTDGCHLRIFCKSRIFYNVSVNLGGCDFSPFLWNPIPIALFVLT